MDNMGHNKCNLNNIFDKVFVIHCVENEKRYKNILYQQKQSKLKLDIWWTCYHPHSYIMANSLILSGKGRYLVNGNELNLTREFYTIIKVSYLKGYDHILIFEDDFNLMKLDKLNEFCDNFPEDFDIIQFGILPNPDTYDYSKILKSYLCKKYFIKMDFGAYGNCGLALSRKGMKYFIDSIDKEFNAADIPIFEDTNKISFYGKVKNTNLNHYIPTMPLVYLNIDNESNIQTGDKSDIYEYYKKINKKYYNINYE